MGYPVAHVGSLVVVGQKTGRVITGAPAHNVGGAGGGAGGISHAVDVFESIGMETEDMTPAQRRAYIEERLGPGTADALERSTDTTVETVEPTTASGNNTPSTQVGCGDLTNETPDSFRISRYFTVADLSTGIYQVPNRHRIPTTTRKGLSRRDVICNLRHLAVNSLDPLKDWLAANAPGITMKIGSGFRNYNDNSDHSKGSAADLHLFKNNGSTRLTRDEVRAMAVRIYNTSGIPSTQFLLEYQDLGNRGWIHFANIKSGVKHRSPVGYTLNVNAGSRAWVWGSLPSRA